MGLCGPDGITRSGQGGREQREEAAGFTGRRPAAGAGVKVQAGLPGRTASLGSSSPQLLSAKK